MRIEFHRNFKKRYKKLPVKMQNQFEMRLFFFKKDPSLPLLGNHPLTGDRKGQWSINITGDWRAIYVLPDEQTALFIDIDTHGNLYGK